MAAREESGKGKSPHHPGRPRSRSPPPTFLAGNDALRVPTRRVYNRPLSSRAATCASQLSSTLPVSGRQPLRTGRATSSFFTVDLAQRAPATWTVFLRFSERLPRQLVRRYRRWRKHGGVLRVMCIQQYSWGCKLPNCVLPLVAGSYRPKSLVHPCGVSGTLVR